MSYGAGPEALGQGSAGMPPSVRVVLAPLIYDPKREEMSVVLQDAGSGNPRLPSSVVTAGGVTPEQHVERMLSEVLPAELTDPPVSSLVWQSGFESRTGRSGLTVELGCTALISAAAADDLYVHESMRPKEISAFQNTGEDSYAARLDGGQLEWIATAIRSLRSMVDWKVSSSTPAERQLTAQILMRLAADPKSFLLGELRTALEALNPDVVAEEGDEVADAPQALRALYRAPQSLHQANFRRELVEQPGSLGESGIIVPTGGTLPTGRGNAPEYTFSDEFLSAADASQARAQWIR